MLPNKRFIVQRNIHVAKTVSGFDRKTEHGRSPEANT